MTIEPSSGGISPAAPPGADQPLLNPAAVRRLLMISPTTMQRWLSSGTLPPADIAIGRRYRAWKRETIDAWIESQRASAAGVRR